jgi:hypothetical protein
MANAWTTICSVDEGPLIMFPMNSLRPEPLVRSPVGVTVTDSGVKSRRELKVKPSPVN